MLAAPPGGTGYARATGPAVAHGPCRAGLGGGLCRPPGRRRVRRSGRYGLTAGVPAAGALRPLRDPDAPELDEDDDSAEWPPEALRWWTGPTHASSRADREAVQGEVEQALRLLSVFGTRRGEGDAFQGSAEVGGPDIGADRPGGRASVHE